MSRCLLITGGSGFIGSNFIRYWLANYPEDKVINFDLLTYAGNPDNLSDVVINDNYIFVHGDINDFDLVRNLIEKENVNIIIHFAAESHVDRSIIGPQTFIKTNIIGTFTLLEAVKDAWFNYSETINHDDRNKLFIHVSTDEVYGSLLPDENPFLESSSYRPNSPYAASKAAADHLVRAYHKTYGLPTIITNCSNNYGPYQFPEKLIPLMIINAIEGKSLPVYGDGKQIRDWIHVIDHCRGIEMVIKKGEIGDCYNIGGNNEKANIDVVLLICEVLQRMKPTNARKQYKEQIKYVEDRPGHDRRYAINNFKAEQVLGWKPQIPFEAGLEETILWYLGNQAWWEKVRDGRYRLFYDNQYKSRLE